MSESSELFEAAHGAEEAVGVTNTVVHAGEGVVDAVEGDWDGAADSSLSMSESAIGVATGGISEAVEMGWDAIAGQTGLPDAHEALKDGTEAAGDLLSDGMLGLVGEEQSYQAAMAFDDGDVLAGLGHMAEGAGDTIGQLAEGAGEAVMDGAESLGGAVADGAEAAGDAIADGAGAIADGAEDLIDDIFD